jgi:uncharacterized protein (DUF2384 family)
MKPSEVVRVFETYHRLLRLFEPNEAVLWLVRPQPPLHDRSPCELLPSQAGYEDVLTVIQQLTDNAPAKRPPHKGT